MTTIPSVDFTVKLKHVLKNVLELPSNSALEMVIMQNSLSSIDDVLANDDKTLAALTFCDGFTMIIKMEDGYSKEERNNDAKSSPWYDHPH